MCLQLEIILLIKMITRRKKNIYFFTGKRGGFSHYISIIRSVQKIKLFKYKIIVGDMHLSNFFGSTVSEINQYTKNLIKLGKFNIKDSKKNRLSVISNTITKVGKILLENKPDLLFLLGDRAEVLGAAIAALHNNIPIVHMYGGDITQGGTDEPTRHAITKISNIHLTSNLQSYKNVISMREEKWRVFNVGLSSLDLFKNDFFKSKKYLENKYKLNLNKPLIILIQHSVTWQVNESKFQINETLKSLDHFKYQTIAIYPCSDPGYKNIVNSMINYNKKKYFKLFKNIEIQDFYSLLKYCTLIIGNSSCGITESEFFKKPTINIGIRQQGRVCGKNVIHVNHKKKHITQAINYVIKNKALFNKIKKENLYGSGNSSTKILKIIKTVIHKKNLVRKQFV